MSFECLDCKAIDGEYCKACATPNDEIRDLMEKWRSDMPSDPYVWEVRLARLEELIDNE